MNNDEEPDLDETEINADDMNEKSFTKITDANFGEREIKLSIDKKLTTDLETSQGTYTSTKPRKGPIFK